MSAHGPFNNRAHAVPHGKPPPRPARTTAATCKRGHPLLGNSRWENCARDGLRRKCILCERENARARDLRKKKAATAIPDIPDPQPVPDPNDDPGTTP